MNAGYFNVGHYSTVARRIGRLNIVLEKDDHLHYSLNGISQDLTPSSLCLTDSGAKKGCALYFMPARLGVVLSPNEVFKDWRRHSLGFDEFTKLAENEYGFILSGFWQNEHGDVKAVGNRPLKGSFNFSHDHDEPVTFSLIKR